VTLTIDPRRTAILPLDLQRDNIVATPRIGEKKIIENIARVLEAGRRRKMPIIHITPRRRAAVPP
jgi:nicotinamidase-related amidase